MAMSTGMSGYTRTNMQISQNEREREEYADKSLAMLKEIAKNTGQKQDVTVDLDGAAVGSKLTRNKSKIKATSGF